MNTTINIKSPFGQTLLGTPINTGAKGYYSLMQHDYITLPFSLPEPIGFALGSYADLRGVFDEALGGKLAKIYYVKNVQNPTYNTSTGGYDYTLRLDAYYWLWANFIFKYTPENAGQEASWSLTAPLSVHLGVYLRNLSALGFTYGTGIAFIFEIDSTVSTEAIALTYSNTNLIDALSMMAEALDCEWWVRENVIHFGKCEQGDPVELEIGVSAETMTRNESKGTYATRVYAFGSTRNIPANYRPTTEQAVVNGVVQKRLMLPEDTPYIDAYPNMTRDQVVETVLVLEDVYPRRIGTLSDVKTVDRAIEDEEGEQTGTFKAYQYKDTGITFDESYILPDKELRIVFQSGKLNGLDFAVTFNPNNSDPAEQLWEIVANEDYGRLLPDETLKPENGDTYILYNFDIALVSDQYISSAEEELKEKAENYVAKTKVDDGTYTVPLYADWVKEDEINRTFDFGQKISLKNPAFFGSENRVSRVIGWEMNLDIPHDRPIYTIGESAQYSRIGELEDKVDAITYGGQTYMGGGGSGVYLIKTNDSTPASNYNAFSALRSLAMFLRKDKDDSAHGHITFEQGLTALADILTDVIRSKDFSTGPFGTGFIVKRDPTTGKSYIETDELYVRLKAYFEALEVKHLSHVGGRFVASPAGMECVRVETVAAEYENLYDSNGQTIYDSEGEEVLVPRTGGEQAYRCYFKQTDGEREIVNEFDIDDLAQCREFNVKEGVSHNVSNQYYWRRVIGLGENYIDLSITDCDTGSMVPKAGDTIVTIGNKTDTERQHVVFLSSYDNDAPCIKLYSGINSYSMLNKEVTVISPNADKNVFTGKVVIKPGSSGFGNLTDAPDMTLINQEIQNAKQDAADASKAAGEVQQSVTNLNNYINGAFSDGIISETESKAIAAYINIVNNEKESAEAVFEELDNNPYLAGSAKVELGNKKNALLTAISALISSINTAISDGKTTTAEKQDVDAKYATFNTACADFNEAVKAAEKSIQDKLKGYSDNAQKAADAAKQAASNAQANANEAKSNVTNLNKYVDGAFKDGIVTETEAKAIATYLNTVNSSKKAMDATYTVLYNNAYLTGTSKSDLYSAKRSFDSAVSSLTSAINTAISDGKATEQEKENVDTKFATFNNAYATLSTAIENANKAIQDKVKQEAKDEAKKDIDAQLGEVDASVKDAIAKQLGYSDYDDMVYYAKRGQTIINGGVINTSILESAIVITSQLIANAIMANTLNVNNKFKVYTDGSVDISGVLHSLGSKTELVVSDGYVRIMYNGTDVAKISVNENTGMPEMALYRNNRSCIVTAERILMNTGLGSNSFLTIDAAEIGYGTVKVNNNGLLYLENNTYDVITVAIRVSPSGSGTTRPSPSSLHMVMKGESETVEAIPYEGYQFDHWSDGGSQKHTVTWSEGGEVLTAYFTEIPTTRYTVTLKASPTAGGSVSGGGSYEEGTRRTVSATANSGYRFIRWSDGGQQSHQVIWDGNKTLTAYFETYTVTDEEIFTGTALTSSSYWEATGGCSISSVSGGEARFLMQQYSGQGEYVIFNKGRLGSKLEQGHRYRLEMEARATTKDALLIAIIGEADEDVLGTVFYGEQVNNGVLNTVYESFVGEFTAERDSTSADGFCIAVNADCTLYIRSISLKEI